MLPQQGRHRPTSHIQLLHASPRLQEASCNQPGGGSVSLALLFASFLLVSWLMQIAAAQTKCASGTLPANGTGQCAAVQLWLACICRLDGLQPISNHGLEPALHAKLERPF